MKKSLRLLFSVFAVAALLSGCSKEKGELNIYSILHDEETQALAELFTKNTGIKVNYLRATTGELVNRVIVEKDQPQADVLLGGASTYHAQADENGALETYVSPLAKKIPSYAKAESGAWTGFCVLSLGIGYNETRFKEKFPGVQIPSTWDDLLNPAFKGEIVMTNPASSSTAYLFVQNQLQRLGWDKGWEYLAKLASQAGQFPDSGSAPPKLVGTGEYAIGISYIHALSKYRERGFFIEIVAPPQSVGDVDCVSIMKNAKNLEAAKKFVDFMLDKPAQELMSSIDFTIPVNPDANYTGTTGIADIDLIEYDRSKAAEQKNEVLSKWAKIN